MKKITSLLLTMLLLILAITPVMANNNITVKIDGQQIAFDVPPQLINDRTMVPLRAIFEALGATVDWNGDTQTVMSTKGSTTISLTINNPTMYVNGTAVTLDSPACLIGSRTLVPVRAISEAFGTTVDWDGNTSTVLISTTQLVPQVSATLKREEIEVKVKPSGSELIFENRSAYPYSFDTVVVNEGIVFDFSVDGKKVSDVTINPGERKQVNCVYGILRKGDNNGVNSYGYVVIEWQGEQYYMDFTVNGITDFYKGNAHGPAN